MRLKRELFPSPSAWAPRRRKGESEWSTEVFLGAAEYQRSWQVCTYWNVLLSHTCEEHTRQAWPLSSHWLISPWLTSGRTIWLQSTRARGQVWRVLNANQWQPTKSLGARRGCSEIKLINGVCLKSLRAVKRRRATAAGAHVGWLRLNQFLAAWGGSLRFSAGRDGRISISGLPLLWLNGGSETNRSPSENLLGQRQDSKDRRPTVGDFLNLSGLLATGPSSRCGRNLTAVVVLWSLTSPYHFSSPAIDSVSVGRRTDKGMCMTLPTDTGDIWVREPLG